MWMFVAGFVAGGIVCVGGLFGFIGFLDIYHVTRGSEFLPAVKAMFLELFRLIAWGLKLTGELEPEGTEPKVGDVIFYRSLKLRVERVDHWTAYAEGHPRKDNGVLKVPARQFLGKVWDHEQWRIKKRPPYEDPAIYWWKSKTVEELEIHKLSATKKSDLARTCSVFGKPWDSVNFTTYDNTYSGTL